MTIDSIITEWTYRLPKGYPTTDSDYDILRNVLSEMTDLSDDDQDKIVNQAKGLEPILTESLKLDSIQNESLITAVQEVNKIDELTKFLSLLPVETEMVTLNFLNDLSYE